MWIEKTSKMSKNSINYTGENCCKMFAESKLLSAVTVLQRDEKRHFSIFKSLTINNLIFKNWLWKFPYFPQGKRTQ